MTNPSIPRIDYGLSRARPRVLQDFPFRTLMIGLKTASATATSGELVLQEDADDVLQVVESFGEGSMLSYGYQVFREINDRSELDFLPIDDAGTQATATILYSGASTQECTHSVTSVSNRDFRKSVNVLSGQTAAEIATEVFNQFDGIYNAPFTVADDGNGTLTFTAVSGGSLPNDWLLSYSGNISGVTITLTEWNGGSGDPNVANILDAIPNDRQYDRYIWPSSFDIQEVRNFLDNREQVFNRIVSGVALSTKEDTLNNLKTYASGINSKNVCILGLTSFVNTSYIGNNVQEDPYAITCNLAAQTALRFEDKASLSRIVSAGVNDIDLRGGIQAATMPYHNLRIRSFSAGAPEGSYFTDLEQVELEAGGISTLGRDDSSSIGSIYGEIVTTKGANVNGDVEFLNRIDTERTIQKYVFYNFKRAYRQTRLTEGDLVTGATIVNADLIRSTMTRWYGDLADKAITQKGYDAEGIFSDSLEIIVNTCDGSVQISFEAPVVGQLRNAIIDQITIFCRQELA